MNRLIEDPSWRTADKREGSKTRWCDHVIVHVISFTFNTLLEHFFYPKVLRWLFFLFLLLEEGILNGMASSIILLIVCVLTIRVANGAALSTGHVLPGLCRGFSEVPLQVALQATVPDQEIGIATAMIVSLSVLSANVGNRWAILLTRCEVLTNQCV